MHKIIHLILVTSLKNVDILQRTIRIFFIRVKRQIASISFRPFTQSAHNGGHFQQLLDISLLQFSNGFASYDLQVLAAKAYEFCSRAATMTEGKPRKNLLKSAPGSVMI